MREKLAHGNLRGVRETFVSLTVVMVSRVYTYVKAKKLYTLKCVLDYWLYLLESTAWWSCDCGVAVDCILGFTMAFPLEGNGQEVFLLTYPEVSLLSAVCRGAS